MKTEIDLHQPQTMLLQIATTSAMGALILELGAANDEATRELPAWLADGRVRIRVQLEIEAERTEVIVALVDGLSGRANTALHANVPTIGVDQAMHAHANAH